MRTNTKKTSRARTHEGAVVSEINPLEQLRRTVLTCLLWEDTFYEGGGTLTDRKRAGAKLKGTVAGRIRDLVPQVDLQAVLDLAIEAREVQRLRHAPLFLMREVIRCGGRSNKVGDALGRVIQRADEIAEFLNIYWKEGRTPLAKQAKRGLAQAFHKFDEYQFAKWDRQTDVKLRDVLFEVHGKTKDCGPGLPVIMAPPINKPKYKRGSVQRHAGSLAHKIVTRTLATPDTWEVNLSGGADKKETFTRLLQDKKLGYFALLSNLRNMEQAGVSRDLVAGALLDGAPFSKVLPFRYVAAARACPSMEPFLDRAMGIALSGMPKLAGETIVVVDVSASMDDPLSEKSDLSRMDAAAALAVLVRGICDNCRVFSFSSGAVEVAPRQGMALIDAIVRSQYHNGTQLEASLAEIQSKLRRKTADRIIVITDGQASSSIRDPFASSGYIINMATYQFGVGYGPWTIINGWSESVVKFIHELEATSQR